MIQFDVIDLTDAAGHRTTSRLEGRWWLPGQEMPAQPQVVATDAKFDAGGIAIGSSFIDGLNSGVIFRWIEVIGGEVEVEPIVDFNGDGTVDIDDLLRIIESWGRNDPAVDIVPDGVVDKKDLEVLMDHWQQDVNDPTLLAHWAFDETEGVVAHDSAGTNDGTVMGLPVWQPTGGTVDGALELDGMTSVVAGCSLSPSDGPFSVLAWVKGGAPGQAVVSQTGGANWLMADASQGALLTQLSRGGRTGAGLPSEAIIADGDWHRIGFTWDGAARTLYVDDVLAAEDTQPGLAACTGGVLIGCGSNMAPGTYWSGLIDEVRIYNRVVTP